MGLAILPTTLVDPCFNNWLSVQHCQKRFFQQPPTRSDVEPQGAQSKHERDSPHTAKPRAGERSRPTRGLKAKHSRGERHIR